LCRSQEENLLAERIRRRSGRLRRIRGRAAFLASLAGSLVVVGAEK
jgi:hypothetical protein